MPHEPLVCAILLTRDRPAMAARAVAAFRAQTYARKRLVMWDSGPIPFAFSMDLPDNESCIEDVPDFAIGNLRNRAAEWSCNSSEPTPEGATRWSPYSTICNSVEPALNIFSAFENPIA